MDFIECMPKVDLHNHIDGGMRAQTIIEIAQDENISLPTYDARELIKHLSVGDDCKSLVEYLQKFDLPLLCLQSANAQRRAAKEAVEDAAKQNVMYLEIRFAPQLMCEKGLKCENVIANVIEGLKEGERKTGIIARAIVCCMRHHDAKKNIEAVKAASQFIGEGLGGVDLAGDEYHFPPHLFKNVFELAHQKGIPITIHAGEAGGAENIKAAVELLGAVRIGHGIRLKENDGILEMIRRKKIPLEICVTSNVQTKAASSFETHPIREYFDKGLVVTANTDNPTVSNTNITRELKILSENYSFTNSELKELQFNAANSAFLFEDERKKLVSKLMAKFDAIAN